MERNKQDIAVTKHIDVQPDEFRWKPFLRQTLISSGCWVVYFTVGLVLGSPTVIIPQMRREANSTAAVSEEMASWLSSTYSYSAVPWIFILPYLARIFGRKKTIIVVSLTVITTFFIFYFNSSPTHLLITEILIGLPHASTITVNIIVISEYTSPKYRGLFLTIKNASLYWGIWVSNTIGTFTHWSYIPVFGFLCVLYTLTVFLWPESPHWLASKRRFVDCRKAHRWLKGHGAKSEEELEQLIKSYSIDAEEYNITNLSFVKRKEFFMPLFLCLLAVIQHHFSGKFVFTIYAVEILKKMMESENSVYRSMIILDGVTVFSTYFGCGLIKVLKRRTVLLYSTGIAISFLFSMSLYLFLVKLSILSENIYISFILLSGFSISISCGPMIISTSLYGELIPHRFKSVTVSIIGVSFFLIQGTLLKISPLIFRTFTLSGTFLFYGITSTVCIVLMFIYLPETKDKTLLEIEEYFREGSSESSKLVKSLD